MQSGHREVTTLKTHLVLSKLTRRENLNGIPANACWIDFAIFASEVRATPLSSLLKWWTSPPATVTVLDGLQDLLPLKSVVILLLYFPRSRKIVADPTGTQRVISLTRLVWHFIKRTWRSIYVLIMLMRAKCHFAGNLFSDIITSRLKDSCGKPPRMLFVRTDFWFGLQAGGSLSHMRGILGAFKKLGWEIHFAGNERIAAVSDLVKSEFIFPPRFGAFASSETNQVAYNYRLGPELEKLLAKGDYDLIYLRHNAFHFKAVEIAVSKGLPLILECNDLVSTGRPAEWRIPRLADLSRKIETFVVSRSSLVSVISRLLLADLKRLGVSGKRIILATNGVDIEEFDSLRNEPLAASLMKRAPIRIGFTGTFAAFHGVEIIPHAAQEVLNELPEAEFVLVGDGALWQKVSNECNRLGVSRAVRLPGIVPHNSIPSFLESCDILISPHTGFKDQDFFGSPTKLFEYMAAGKAIVASALGQITEILEGGCHQPRAGAEAIDGGAAGLLVTPGDASELAQAILLLARRLDLRRLLGENARRRVEAKYTWQANVVNLMSVLGGQGNVV